VVAPIGAGGMGEVYRARDSTLGRDVALKVLSPALAADPQYMARFQREAQVLASLNHPHIAVLHGLQESEGIRALIMELVEGPTLAERIAPGPIPVEEALPIARQIADALETAHERGIVHRDLKPANVKFTSGGAAKVLDFGLAKALDDDATPTGVNSPTITMGATRAGVILGTAAYMPPEQAKGKRVDRRADIWAFGVVLFEMLTGRRLYDQETAPETLASVMRDEPAWALLPANTPPAVRTLLRRCLDKDPRRRLRDIGEARIALETDAGSTAATSAPPAAPRPAARLPWALFAIALLGALAVSILHWRETPPAERVLRYAILPPPKGAIQTFALSPDGRYLAMSILMERKRQLWVRALDALQPQLLPGSDDAHYPFWSPDSRYIGFFAQGKLKKIAVTGGPAQVLCDAADGRGGTWSREGVIVFTPNGSLGALQRVQAVGGVPARASKNTDEASFVRYPAFLPDGKRFLYLSLGSPENAGVYLGSLSGETGGRVLAGASSAVYALPQPGSRNGHLLFLRDNTLMAQPVEPDSLRPTGEIFPVAEQIGQRNSSSLAPISVSNGGMLAYKYGVAAGDSELVWCDRTGKELARVGAPLVSMGFGLSRDEKTVAIARIDPAAKSTDIWLHDARGIDSRLTVHASLNMQPVFSPDGRRLIFTSGRGGAFTLYLKETSGSTPDELLLKGTNSRFPTDWSYDGRLLMYVDTDAKNKWDLWTVPVDGERKPTPFLQSEFNECQGQFSPDGKWVAYSSDESGRYEIYVRPFPPGSGKWKISNGGGQHARWRRDGRELFYLDPSQTIMSVAVKAGGGANASLEAASPQALFDSRAVVEPAGFNNFHYAPSADGKRFLVNIGAGDAGDMPVVVVTNWLAALKK